MSGDNHNQADPVDEVTILTPELAANVAAVERVRAARLTGHRLLRGGATYCPAQRVHSTAHDLTCSACGAPVSS